MEFLPHERFCEWGRQGGGPLGTPLGRGVASVLECQSGRCCRQVCRAAGESCGPICGDGALDVTEGCDDGNNAGADGCAANCTVEGTLSMDLGDRAGLSAVTIRTSMLEVAAVLSGQLTLHVGAPTGAPGTTAADRLSHFQAGDVPIAATPADLSLSAAALPGLGCVRLAAVAIRTCAGAPRFAGDERRISCAHNPGVCRQDHPCADTFAGNSIVGVLRCTGGSDAAYTFELNGLLGTTASTRHGPSAPGALFLLGAFRLHVDADGMCMSEGHENAIDFTPTLTTDGAVAVVRNADAVLASTLSASIKGRHLDCGAALSNGQAPPGFTLVWASPIENLPLGGSGGAPRTRWWSVHCRLRLRLRR